MPHVACANATADDIFMGRDNIGDDKGSESRAGGGRRQPGAKRDRTPGAGRRELDDPNVFRWRHILVESPTQASIELLGSLDVGHGDDIDLQFHIDHACLLQLQRFLRRRYRACKTKLFHRISARAGLHDATPPSERPHPDRQRCAKRQNDLLGAEPDNR
jgi:hypothetical protein